MLPNMWHDYKRKSKGEYMMDDFNVVAGHERSLVAGHESSVVVWPEENAARERKREDQERSVTLTNGEWEIVYLYLKCSTYDIKDYIAERGDDVSGKFWLERIDKIKKIMEKIQGQP